MARFEPVDEGFTVTLSGASGDAQITTATASGTIQNDDAEPLPDIDVEMTGQADDVHLWDFGLARHGGGVADVYHSQ